VSAIPRVLRAATGRVSLTSKQRARRVLNPLRLGVLHRRRPLSDWGWNRGTPVDRVYIERFLADHRDDIRGRVLEVKDADYTTRFGVAVTRSDILDIDADNPSATIVADLCDMRDGPREAFDCVILTQTLQFVSDPARAIASAHSLLRSGGVLLATVPTITRADRSYDEDIDRWRFTGVGFRQLVGSVFGPATSVRSYGNVLAAIAFLAGIAAEELTEPDLWDRDPDYEVLVAVRAVKGAT
jgi:SAM-dependent methyltransferase